MRILPKKLRVPAPSVASPGRRRRVVRADAPKTIIPVDEAAPFAVRLDAARERLRAAIPPAGDDE